MSGYAWTVTNALSSLAASAFTWASGPSDATRLYMTDGRMGKQFACTSASSGNTLTVDFGTATALTGWALLNHNLASFGGAVTLVIQGADDSGFSVNLVTAKASTTLDFTSPHEKDCVLQMASVSKRYWRLVFTWTGDKVLKVGEVFAYASANRSALSRKDIYGQSAEGYRVRTVKVETDHLEQRGYLVAGPQRMKKLVFSDQSEAENAELLALWAAARETVPVLFITSQNEVDTAAAAVDQDVMFAQLRREDFMSAFVDYSRRGPPELLLVNMGREVGA